MKPQEPITTTRDKVHLFIFVPFKKCRNCMSRSFDSKTKVCSGAWSLAPTTYCYCPYVRLLLVLNSAVREGSVTSLLGTLPPKGRHSLLPLPWGRALDMGLPSLGIGNTIGMRHRQRRQIRENLLVEGDCLDMGQSHTLLDATHRRG